MIIDESTYLEHYGVPGMKWGVRRNRRAERLAKVGRGEGSKSDKIRALGNVSLKDVAKGRGLKGAAKLRSDIQIARNERVASGKASVRDKLAYHGSARLSDLVPTRAPKGSKKPRGLDAKLQAQAKSADKRTAQGKKIQSMANESARIKAAGGGLKGTVRVRREMIKSGELSKEDARKGTVRFGATITGAILLGGAAGTVLGKGIVKTIK